MFQTRKRCLCPVFPHCELPTKILPWFHFFFCPLSWTFPIPEVLTSATEQACYCRSGFAILVPLRQFLDVVSVAYIHWQIKLLGFGASLNSIVATSAEHSIHLSIFQLPQRTHHEIQIFVMAEASVDVHTSTCSSSSPQSSFHRQELGSNEVSHGEENPVQRIRTSRLLLHPSPCQKTGETQRSCAINAIDRALKFWKAKPVRRPVPVHAL